MIDLPRLRQVALVAHDLGAVAGELQKTFGWGDPFHDPGVGEFGLENSVFAAGDTFIEVVSPVRDGTAAGRYMDRRGGDSGYMAIFQVPDVKAARQKIAGAGIRTVWKVDLDDIAGTHLHPKDVPGAIVPIDWADPPQSWRWGGPDWTRKGAPNRRGSIKAITVELNEPAAGADRWSAALGVAPTKGDTAIIRLDGAGQTLRFVQLASDREEGITEVVLEGDDAVDAEIGGVRFRTEGRVSVP
jgi:hypothetical protein